VVHRLLVAVLRQAAQGVLENLLHMAAHGLAAARGISDTPHAASTTTRSTGSWPRKSASRSTTPAHAVGTTPACA
jgi:hypothetical protein